jgi:hypothetical protein
MTIDNHARAMIVLDQLKAALPLPARLTPELQASLSGANRAKPVPAGCTIIGLHYMGDEGSVTCKLDLGPAITKRPTYRSHTCASMRGCRWPVSSPPIRSTR